VSVIGSLVNEKSGDARVGRVQVQSEHCEVLGLSIISVLFRSRYLD
jgi:hypothetical protein